ncbi:MAG: hypothetical protein Q8R82_09505 [Hyphomonadaceae bacterium]|nr:hypothetical protein [Hyphomonadaceae bacterium]
MRLAGIALLMSLGLAPVAVGQTPGECAGQPLSPLPEPWLNTAVAITTFTETGKPADYSAIADNADEQGMSIGILQWNFGQGTIAKIVNGTQNVDAVALETMPTFGKKFVAEAKRSGGSKSERDAATAWVAGAQTSDKATLHAELRKFLAHPAVQKSQDNAARAEGEEAWKRASAWMEKVRTGCTPQFAQFAVFFDYLNHGGKGNSIEITDVVAAYGEARGKNIDSATRNKYSQFIAFGEATWVMGFPHYRPCTIPSIERSQENDKNEVTDVSNKHAWDSQYNCAIWSDMIKFNTGENLWKNEIYFLAAQGARFRPGYREIFFNRKGTIALGRGVINGSMCDFRPLYIDREKNRPATLSEISAAVKSSCGTASPVAN